MSYLVTNPTKWHVRPAKIQISLGIRPVWSYSSLSAWRKLGSLATQWAHSKDSDQTKRMPRLIWVFAGRTCHFVGFVMRRLKYFDIRYSPWQTLYHISISFWYSGVLYTCQVLEVVRNGKNSMCLLILLSLSLNKSPFHQFYTRSVPKSRWAGLWENVPYVISGQQRRRSDWYQSDL